MLVWDIDVSLVESENCVRVTDTLSLALGTIIQLNRNSGIISGSPMRNL